MIIKTTYHKIYVRLAEFVLKTDKELIIVVPFITVGALSFLLKNIKTDIKIIIVARWRLMDLIMGVSDLKIYDLMKKFNATIYINNNIHLKVLLRDRKEMIIGSANLTKKGIGLDKQSNIELITGLDVQHRDVEEILNIIKDSIEVNDKIYVKFMKEFEKYKHLKNEYLKNKEEFKRFENSIEQEKKVHVFDFPFSDNPTILYNKIKDKNINSNEIKHDIQLLGLDVKSKTLLEDIKSSFLNSCAFKWQFKKINKQILFGEYTKLLHDSLIDEPAPYRIDVKKLVSNMFNWTSELSEDYKIIKHNHTNSMKPIFI